MPRPPHKRLRPAETQDALRGIFRHPPVNPAELEQRLRDLDVSSARRFLIDKLRAPQLGEAEGGLIISIFRVLGLGDATEALIELVCDREAQRRARAYALTSLLHEDGSVGERLRRSVPEGELLLLAAQPVFDVLVSVESDPAAAGEVASALEGLDPAMQPALFSQLEQLRRQVGTPAVIAYGEVLQRGSVTNPAVRKELIAALVEEGGADAAMLLQSLRDGEKDPLLRRELQGALLRLRTRSLDGQAQSLGEYSARISSCDGQGAYFVLGSRKNPDGRVTLALLCVRAAADLRDGYVLTAQPPAQQKKLLQAFSAEAGTQFAQVSPPVACALIKGAVSRTLALGMPLPVDSLPALRFFERFEPQPLPAIEPAPRSKLTAAALRKLLARPEYRVSWFFDDADLQSTNIPPERLPPGPRSPLVAAVLQALHDSGGAGLTRRVVAMARHMALFHSLRGEVKEAALLSAAADATEQDFVRSPLCRVLLERYFEPPDDEDDAAAPLPEAGPHEPVRSRAQDPMTSELESRDEGDETGDDDAEIGGLADVGIDAAGDIPDLFRAVTSRPARRQHLKGRFFASVESPRGRDLLLLDLTEAVTLGLHRALALLPGDVRPRDEQQEQAAYAMAVDLRSFLLDRRRSDVKALAGKLAEELVKTCYLPSEIASALALSVLLVATRFVDEVCGRCPVRCIDEPARLVREPYFAPHHPAKKR
ncbi:MAG: hypothetical protein U1A78_36575 [Polyangia bacterium]